MISITLGGGVSALRTYVDTVPTGYYVSFSNTNSGQNTIATIKKPNGVTHSITLGYNGTNNIANCLAFPYYINRVNGAVYFALLAGSSKCGPLMKNVILNNNDTVTDLGWTFSGF